MSYFMSRPGTSKEMPPAFWGWWGVCHSSGGGDTPEYHYDCVVVGTGLLTDLYWPSLVVVVEKVREG